jgi:hypothetical protein
MQREDGGVRKRDKHTHHTHDSWRAHTLSHTHAPRGHTSERSTAFSVVTLHDGVSEKMLCLRGGLLNGGGGSARAQEDVGGERV